MGDVQEPNTETTAVQTQKENDVDPSVDVSAVGIITEIPVGKKHLLFPNKPLPQFDTKYARAYAARRRKATTEEAYCLIMESRFPIREEALSTFMDMDNTNIVNLIGEGIVNWHEDGTRRRALIFELPPGERLMSEPTAKIDKISENELIQYVIKPAFSALQQLSDRGVFHGAIRPTNIYRASAEASPIAIGECISGIIGLEQPILFETIERSLADAGARGHGTIKDDLYALGISICIIARSENPYAEMPDDDLLTLKIEKGSYALISEGIRASPSLSEFLRGILTDDYHQRWGIDEVDSWLNGRRLTPQQKSRPAIASRGLEFNGESYTRPRLLAKDLHNNPDGAIELIESGALELWINRSLGDNSMAISLEEAVTSASNSGRAGNYGDRLACYVSMALDPGAPIRFRGLNVLPSGIGAALYLAILNGKDTEKLEELIQGRYAMSWLGEAANQRADTAELMRNFDFCSKVVGRKGFDAGLERCLYEIYPDAPCLSPMFEGDCVVEMTDIIPALERAAGKKNKPDMPLDRHMAGFISVRDVKDHAGMIVGIMKPDRVWQNLSLVTLLAGFARRFYPAAVPKLCAWLNPRFKLVAERYNSVEKREAALKALEPMVEAGTLLQIIKLLDDPKQVANDRQDLTRAKARQQFLQQKVKRLEKKIERGISAHLGSGRELAALISSVLAVIAILGCILMALTN